MTVKVYRITCGSIVLLIVDLICVLSTELTEYLYKDKSYNKPFFSTYCKTSLFTIYLLAFIVCKSWRQQCHQLFRSSALVNNDMLLAPNGNTCGQQSGVCRSTPLYSVLDSSGDQLNEELTEDELSDCNEGKGSSQWEQVLSEPIWVPIKFSSDASALNSEKSSGTESDTQCDKYHNSVHNSSHSSTNHQKSVRFSKLTEVRQLSETQAEDALLARLSYQATIRAQEQSFQTSRLNANKLSIVETIKLSLIFSFVWFLANWSFQLALKYSEAGLVNLLSSTSSLFTILLSPIFPSNSSSDNFSLTKLVAVLISVGSVATLTTQQSRLDSISYIPIGALWALSGAFFYATYVVLLRYKVSSEDAIDIPMFFGFVGFFNLVLLWPALFVLDWSQVEVFQWPDVEQWCILLVNGLIGTVLSEFLWLWGCFLTSSLLASLSVSLTIPLTILFDVLLKGVAYPRLFFMGTIPLYLSFFAITLLSHYDNWDPLASVLLRLVRHSVLRKPVIRASDPLYCEQSQSLINENSA